MGFVVKNAETTIQLPLGLKEVRGVRVVDDELLTTADVANLLGITASRVRQLIDELGVEKIKRGRDLYIRRSDLWRFESRPGMGRPPKSKK